MAGLVVESIIDLIEDLSELVIYYADYNISVQNSIENELSQVKTDISRIIDEGPLSSELSMEISRAKSVESSLSSYISQEVSRSISSDESLENSITSLSSALSYETSRATSAELSLTSSIQWVLETGTSNIYNVNNGNVGIGISNPSVKLEVNGDIQATSVNTISDRRLKSGIENLSLKEAINFINKLKPKKYFLKKTESGEEIENKTRFGFISQDIEEEFANLNLAVLNIPQDKTKMQSLNYLEIISPLVKVIQDLQKKVSILENLHES